MTALTFPRRQGRYVLLKELGRGAMGQTFLAASREAGVERLCVLKAGLPGLSAPLAKRFEDEARVLSRLSFANLVELYEVGNAGGQRFISMEFVHGRTIEETLSVCPEKGVTVPPTVALLVARDLAQALHYLHTSDLKVLHRDVAAANVMLAFTGDVKLIDFGLAKSSLTTDMTAPGIPHGHGAYLAPERLLGKPTDARADIFSAGVILWELLTGQSANVVPGWDEGMSWRVPLPAPSTKRPDLGAGLDKLVMDATAIDPKGRFSDADAFRRAIVGELATRSVQTDAAALATFLASLFGDQIAAERDEIANLLGQARALLSDSAGLLAPGAAPAAIQPGQDPRIGELLGSKYLVESRCGHGGMGDVYIGKHQEIGRRVAIKILREAFMGQVDVIQRFKREMLAIGRIEHQNVVAITDSGITADRCPFYVMEFVEGESLKEAIGRRGAFPVEEALEIALEIAAGVESAHALGIVHRDLKPGNVMLCARTADGAVRAKVLDFGIAKDLRSPNATLTHLDRAVGSPDYMAPEQAQGRDIDFRSDVYAFGVVLFEMLCRRLPFVDASPAVVINRKLNEDPPAPSSLRPDISPAIDRLVLCALSREPAQRPQSMKEVRALLSEALDAGRHAITAPVTLDLKRIPGPRSRRRAVAIGALALGVIGMAALGLLRGSDNTSAKRVEDQERAQARPRHEASPEARKPAEVERRPAVVIEELPAAPTPAPLDQTPRIPTRTTRTAPGTLAPDTGAIPAVRPSRRAVARAEAPSLPPFRPDEVPNAPSPPPPPSPAATPSSRPRSLAAAETALASGDFPAAAILAQKALDSHAPEKEARLVLGQAEFMLTRYREADEQFRRVLAIDPANAEAREGLKSVRRRLAPER